LRVVYSNVWHQFYRFFGNDACQQWVHRRGLPPLPAKLSLRNSERLKNHSNPPHNKDEFGAGEMFIHVLFQTNRVGWLGEVFMMEQTSPNINRP